VRRIPSGFKDDVMTDRVSQGIDHLSRFAGARIRVYSDPAEVVTEAPFHHPTRIGIQRLTRRTENFIDDRLRARRFRAAGTAALHDARSAAVGALSRETRRAATCTPALQQSALLRRSAEVHRLLRGCDSPSAHRLSSK
jgi:hypothetical protein